MDKLIDTYFFSKTLVDLKLINTYINDKEFKLDYQNKYGSTDLMTASNFNIVELALNLIKKGANLDLQDKNGHTALMYACWGDSTNTALILIKKGANLDLQSSNGFTALTWACCSFMDNVEIVCYLLECLDQ